MKGAAVIAAVAAVTAVAAAAVAVDNSTVIVAVFAVG
jgi:hypothetical protein